MGGLMTAPVSTPMLDKAASEELTSREIMQALRELTALDPDKRRFGLKILNSALSHDIHVEVTISDRPCWRFFDTIEDALIDMHKDVASIVAEIEADAS
jgi:hypothetical protein